MAVSSLRTVELRSIRLGRLCSNTASIFFCWSAVRLSFCAHSGLSHQRPWGPRWNGRRPSVGGGPVLSGALYCGAGTADCAIAAPDAQAIHSRPARESRRAVLPCRMLVCLDNVFARWRGGGSAD